MFPCRPMVRDRVGGGMATDRTISRASLIRWLFPFVLAALALLALERTFGPGAPNVPRAPAPPPIFVGGPQSYEEALSRIDASLAGARQRAEERSGDWLMHAVLARRYLARARLDRKRTRLNSRH